MEGELKGREIKRMIDLVNAMLCYKKWGAPQATCTVGCHHPVNLNLF